MKGLGYPASPRHRPAGGHGTAVLQAAAAAQVCGMPVQVARDSHTDKLQTGEAARSHVGDSGSQAEQKASG